MRRMFSAAVMTAGLLCGLPAAAQTPTAPAAAAPAASRFSIGGTAGASVAPKAGALGGGEIAFHLTDRIDVLGEGLGLQDVVTTGRVDSAATVAAFLQSSQGSPASSTIKAAAFYAGGGLRLMLGKPGSVRPFVTVGAGMARVALKPSFTLGGTDVTANLSQYGVTLGSDLTGTTTSAAFGAGAGVRMLHGRWYIDGGVRYINIRTAGEPTNVVGVSAGLGLRF